MRRYGLGRAMEIAKNLRSRYSLRAHPVNARFLWRLDCRVDNREYQLPTVHPPAGPSDTANVLGINEFQRRDRNLTLEKLKL